LRPTQRLARALRTVRLDSGIVAVGALDLKFVARGLCCASRRREGAPPYACVPRNGWRERPGLFGLGLGMVAVGALDVKFMAHGLCCASRRREGRHRTLVSPPTVRERKELFG